MGSSLEPTNLADDVATYVGFGEHRAGTPAEVATAGWLAARLVRLGYAVEQQCFPIRTILDPGGEIACAGATTRVFPQWLPPDDALGQAITAPLLPLSAAARPSIRLLTEPAPLRGNWSPVQDALVRDAVAKGARALVLAPNDKTGDLYVSNQHALTPLPIPVALIARRDLSALADIALRTQSAAQLTLGGRLTDTNALNLIGRKAGRGRVIVISTPLTGWFTCGAERGPGVALLLRMAAQLAHIEQPVLLLGTGSHEIGHLGMAHLLVNGVPRPAEVAFWFHFGASIGARKLDAAHGVASSHMLAGTAESEAQVRTALSALVPVYVNGDTQTAGESGQVIGAGYTRFAGMVGTFPGFHTPSDRGEAIDYGLLEAISRAAAAVLSTAVP